VEVQRRRRRGGKWKEGIRMKGQCESRCVVANVADISFIFYALDMKNRHDYSERL